MEKESCFIQKNYQKKSTFASFLPGIAGEKGIPIWCYYVNRGQGVVSFGVSDKDHSIMEYYPAHQAYQNVNRLGFRTFIKKDGTYLEAFQNPQNETKLYIYKNLLKLEETLKENLSIAITYFTLQKEPLGALVREVCIKNTGFQETKLEILDGMPALLPYGVSLDSIKSMGQTSKAWMQVEKTESKIPFFRLRASMDDTADVKVVEGGNFGMGCLRDGTRMTSFVDPVQIFSYDTSLSQAVGFMQKSLKELAKEEQRMQNQLPCCFFGAEKELKAGEEFVFYEMIGQVESKQLLDSYFATSKNGSYFEMNKMAACELTQQLCQNMETKTADANFDEYCKYTYMDNVLRGGYPIKLTENKIFYLYSRKHGDLERDYNFFCVLPEFYSQGNGNFRDVNQNRRCDTFFAPFLKRENIKQFYSLIQMDGYNPLGIEKITYTLTQDMQRQIGEGMNEVQKRKWKELEGFFSTAFTPGILYEKLMQVFEPEFAKKMFFDCIESSKQEINGAFLEGYWSDHWTYNLDLIMDYLEVFPEEEKNMLLEESYTYFSSKAHVLERQDRYVKTQKGIRQYHFIKKEEIDAQQGKEVCSEFGTGEVYKGTLIEKLILLCALKFATLDAYGMGVEMEGGKPGWYDALNGLPGMLGSSMPETYELLRMMEYTLHALELSNEKLLVFKELYVFLEDLNEKMKEEEPLKCNWDSIAFWEKMNQAKEQYRKKIYSGIGGEKQEILETEMYEILDKMKQIVLHGIQKAKMLCGEIVPTYFTFEVTDYEYIENKIYPKGFGAHPVAYFLEGPVRYLKLNQDLEEKQRLYQAIKTSDLYDEKLSMYKVNASLEKESYELGRARAFTPGWLENESIWMHMEYKYLLELLRSGLYEEFFTDLKNAAVPFLNEEVYGRSIYENSSFIASSKNPDKNIHGKGFVARLSGSTIEFISIWKMMMFGKNYFQQRENKLSFAPQPAIPAYLIPKEKEVSARFLGEVKVTYYFAEQKNYIPGDYKIVQMTFYGKEKEVWTISGGLSDEKTAEKLRNLEIERIEIVVN